MAFEFLINGYVQLAEVVIVLFILWVLRWKIMRQEPSLDELDAIVAQQEADIQELQAKLTTLHIEVYDYIDGSLKPLIQRNATREARAKRKDLSNSDDSEKKGGIIPFPPGYKQ